VKPNQQMTLDASESLFFKRQLEAISTTLYEQLYPENNARDLIPPVTDNPDWAREYTQRMVERVGRAKFIGDEADDLPLTDAIASERSKIIKPLGDSYKFSIFDIKAAAATNTPLQDQRAKSARRGVDDLIDQTLMLGSTPHNLEGLLTLANTQTLAAGAKSGGGLTWAAGNPKEVSDDVTGLVSLIVETLENRKDAMFSRFVIVIPYKQYRQLATTQFSQASDAKILDWLKGDPSIEDVVPSRWCKGAGAGGTDRMVVFPRTNEVVGAIVPVDFMTEPPEKRNLTYIVNCWATCGGITCPYPVAVGYMDGI
jgi:hypothetical protein